MINFLEDLFHEYGYPEKLRSDSGPQYRGEFERFTKRAGIDWKPSSAYYPESNGKVERQVGIIKHLLDKTQRSGENFKDAWFALQNTPRTTEGMSPTRLFYGRIIKSPKLPQLTDGLDENAGGDAIQANRERRKMKKNENKNKVDTNPIWLKEGMQVLLQGVNTNLWNIEGVIHSV